MIREDKGEKEKSGEMDKHGSVLGKHALAVKESVCFVCQYKKEKMWRMSRSRLSEKMP